MHRKLLSGINPGLLWPESRLLRQLPEFRDGVFVGILGMDALSGLKAESTPADADGLDLHTLEVHFDAPGPGIVKSHMAKLREVKISVEFPIDPAQQIQIKFRSYALRIVVGSMKNSGIFFQIHANKHGSPRTGQFTRGRQKSLRLLWRQIAYG